MLQNKTICLLLNGTLEAQSSLYAKANIVLLDVVCDLDSILDKIRSTKIHYNSYQKFTEEDIRILRGKARERQ